MSLETKCKMSEKQKINMSAIFTKLGILPCLRSKLSLSEGDETKLYK